MAAREPATFADVPDAVLLQVFELLPFKDRVSLAQT